MTKKVMGSGKAKPSSATISNTKKTPPRPEMGKGSRAAAAAAPIKPKKKPIGITIKPKPRVPPPDLKKGLPGKPMLDKSGKPIVGAKATDLKGGKTSPAAAPRGKSAGSGKKGDVKTLADQLKGRYSVMTSEAMASSRAAAAKLSAAAGLHSVKSTSNGETTERNYTRVTKTPFAKKELKEFRDLLVDKRRQLAGDVTSMEKEALSGGSGSLSHLPQHMADQGTDTFDQSLALDLAASQRGLLKEIDDALGRIENGTFGICELLGKPINIERLRQTPWARYSIEAARQVERASYTR